MAAVLKVLSRRALDGRPRFGLNEEHHDQIAQGRPATRLCCARPWPKSAGAAAGPGRLAINTFEGGLIFGLSGVTGVFSVAAVIMLLAALFISLRVRRDLFQR